MDNHTVCVIMIKIHSPFITELAFTSKFPFLERQEWIKGKAVWPFVFHSEANPSEELIEHERVHLRQQLRGLLIVFYIRYFYYHVKYGYWNNPYEVEARAVTRQVMKAYADYEEWREKREVIKAKKGGTNEK